MNKSILSQCIDMFAKLSTAIFLFSSIYIAVFNGIEGGLSVKYVWGVLAISFVITLARIPFFLDKEYSKTGFILINVIFFVFSNTVVLVVGFILSWFSFEHPATIIGMEITFVVVFVVVWVLIYLNMKHSAVKMNEKLKEMKNPDNM